jgi:hypothetical protein
MKYLKFTYVDLLTGISVAKTPAMNGTKFPDVAGLTFVWAQESAYPTPIPSFFGTCPDTADTNVEGVLAVLNEADYVNFLADEMRARDKTPKAVTMRQARLQLLAAGYLPTVTDAIAAMTGPEGEAARIEWEYATEVKRSQPLTQALITVLGLTDEQMNELFVAAVEL